jgi:hypothetical protein
MPNIALVSTSDTFEQWRVKTNLTITDLNDLTGGGNVKIGASGIDVDFDNNDANSQFLVTIDGTQRLSLSTQGNLVVTGSIQGTSAALSGDLAIATNKFTVASATGNTSIAGNVTIASGKASIDASTGTITTIGNIVVSGTVDGVDVSAFKSQYDNRPILQIFSVTNTLLYSM